MRGAVDSLKKRINEGFRAGEVPEVVCLARKDRDGHEEMFTVRCDSGGDVEDVSFKCEQDGAAVSVHGNEAVVMVGNSDIRYYYFDDKGAVAHAARLCVDRYERVKPTKVDKMCMDSDKRSIAGARRLFAQAIDEVGKFEFRPFFDGEDSWA